MRDWLTHRAHASPDATALVDAGTGDRWRYADLDEAVDVVAGRLRSLGVGRGDRLGVVTNARVAVVHLVHAVERLGAVLVPLNTRLARPELRSQCDRVDPAALVCDGETAADVRAVADALSIPAVSVDRASEVALADRTPELVTPAERGRTDPRLVLFTSGTTGDPKAVVLDAGTLLSSATASAFRLGVLPGDRWLCCLPMYHMGGLAPVIRSTLYGTAAVVVEGFDTDRVAAAMNEYDVTGVSLVPTMVRRLLDAGVAFPDSLRFVLLGGAPTPPSLIERCERRDVPVCPTYGTTETASQVATARPDEAYAHPDSVGRPLAFTTVTAVDESGDPLAPGEPGELVVSGPTVMQGYHDAPDATAAAFGPHGFHTGDVGLVDEDGRVRVLGRLDDRIVSGGENVHPGTVSEVLAAHPAIDDAAVVGLDDPDWGQRVAALVASTGRITPEEVRAFCDGRLAGYKQPRTITFADELPRTASGTVDRERVRERLRAERNGN